VLNPLRKPLRRSLLTGGVLILVFGLIAGGFYLRHTRSFSSHVEKNRDIRRRHSTMGQLQSTLTKLETQHKKVIAGTDQDVRNRFQSTRKKVLQLLGTLETQIKNDEHLRPSHYRAIERVTLEKLNELDRTIDADPQSVDWARTHQRSLTNWINLNDQISTVRRLDQKWIHSHDQDLRERQWIGLYAIGGGILLLLCSVGVIGYRVIEEVDTQRDRRRDTRQELIESRRRVRQAIDEAPVPIMIHSEGDVLRVNEEWRTRSGYTKSEITRVEEWVDRMAGGDPDSMETFLSSDDTTRKILDVETREGKTREWFFHTTTVPHMERKEPVHVTIAIDVSGRQQAFRETRKREVRLRQMAENIDQQVFWLTDADREEVIYVSPAFESIFGLDAEELNGQSDPIEVFMDMVHPDDRSDLEDQLGKQKEGDYDVEYRIKRPDGEVRWIHDRAFPVEDEDGEVYRIAGLAEDVTEFKETEQKLHQQRAEFESLVENVPGVVYGCQMDAQWTMRYVSESIEELTGYTPDEITNNKAVSYADLIVHGDQERVTNTVREAVEADEPYDLEYRIEHKTGEVRWVMERGQAVRDPIDGEIDLMGVILDITEQKENRRQLRQTEKMAALGEMAAGMMHEINNPNAFIRGNAQLLREDWESLESHLDESNETVETLEAEIEQSLDEIHEGTDRIEEIVNNVKSFAHGHTSGETQSEPVDVEEIVVDATEDMRKTSPVDLSLEVEEFDHSPRIEADAGEFKQVLYNLIDNATDAARQAEDPAVKVQVGTNGDQARFAVADNGPDVPENVRENMFDPFFTTKETGDGTGLGLSIVNGIVERLDGTIEVTDAETLNKKFVVRVPLI
jgi:PAS domain S-box-containing protein